MNFKNIYNKRPDKVEIGSSGFSRMKNLHDYLYEFNPETIIESGTWKGNSSFLFRHACPNAEIICHDITFSNLMWRDTSIKYIESDIEKSDYSKMTQQQKDKTLLFFDDHISQEKRLKWCIENGFKTMIFDDNVTEAEAKTLKNPASPTLEMINISDYWSGKYEYFVFPFLGKERLNRDTRLTLLKLID